MVNYTKPETRKRMCDRETINSLQQKKKGGSIVIRKTINMCLCWIFLIMLTEWAACYCDTLSLQWPFFLQKASATSPKYCPFA